MRVAVFIGAGLMAVAALGSGVPGPAAAQIRLAPEPLATAEYTGRYGLGADPDPALIAVLDIDVMADGRGLPRGSGTVFGGAFVYRERCLDCHGADLGGVDGVRGGALIGGRGSLRSASPVKTVESYWPFATTLMDYVARAMPPANPGTLGPNELYGVVAFILYRGGIIGGEAVMNPGTLAAVKMPNRDGFSNGNGQIETFKWRE